MKLFIRILLFGLVVLVANVKVKSATIAFPNIQEVTGYSSLHTEIPKTVLKIIENDWENCCQNGNDLVDYRDWGLGVGVNVTKGGGRGLVNLTEETFSQALFKGAENVGGYSVYGTKGLVGNTFNRNIFLLEASGSKSLSGFRSFVGSLEAEAIGAGANKISIYGSSVINKGFLNPNIARRFGYTFE